VNHSSDPNSLFRILPFQHVVDLFETKTLHFSLPGLWDDPYERLVDYHRQESVFAQCWSQCETSDALWRIYSSNRMGLSIRSTRSRLAQALEDQSSSLSIQYMLLNVDYLRDHDAVARAGALVHDAEAAGNLLRGVMASLFVKREAFSHEREVRAVIYAHDGLASSGPRTYMRLPVDPHELVEQIVFDPRADPTFERVCTYYLREHLGYQGLITRSNLYAPSETLIAV
jgi:hypothetical protein